MGRKRQFRCLSVFVLLIAGLCCGCPTPPRATWVRLYGGDSIDYGRDVRQTADGGYIIAATTYSFDTWNGDMYLIKADANGRASWTFLFGGFEFEHAYRVVQADDGGYVMLGTTTSYGAGGTDACLVKVDAGGDEVWHSTYGTADDDYATGLAKTGDGGYILAGYTPSLQNGTADFYLVKTDANGIEEWSRTIDYGGEEMGSGVVPTNNGFAISGIRIVVDTKILHDASPGYTEHMCLLRTDSDGHPKWMKEYGDFSAGFDLCTTGDGGYLVAGASEADFEDPVDENNGFAVKTDAAGDEIWSLIYDMPAEECRLGSVKETSDGAFIFAGDQGDAALLLKVNDLGEEIWSRRHGKTRTGTATGYAVVESSYGGYCMVGSQHNSASDNWSVYAVKTDASGNTRLPLPVLTTFP